MEPISAWHFYPAAEDSASPARKANGRGQCCGAHRPARGHLWAHLKSNTWAPRPDAIDFLSATEIFSLCWGPRVGKGDGENSRRRKKRKLEGVREILIRRGGREGWLGIRSMKWRNVEGERDDGAGEQERLDSDRTRWLIERCRELRVFPCFGAGVWAGGMCSPRICTVELITKHYPLRKHSAVLIAQFKTAGGRTGFS